MPLGRRPLGRTGTVALALGLLSIPAAALAGADMVVVNPGGGVAPDGSDGLQAVINGARLYVPVGATSFGVETTGQDEQFFAGTRQWQGTGSGPNVNIGGQLIGDSSVAALGSPRWGSVEIVSTSGSATRVPAGTTMPATPPTGDGAATIRYTATYKSLTYVLERALSYSFPNSFYTETYTMTIPSGNADTDQVKLYLGGTVAPGGHSLGGVWGAMTTAPRRTVYQIGPARVSPRAMYISYGEVAGGSPLGSWFAGFYYSPRAWYSAGTDLDNSVTGPQEAGLSVEWNFGSLPGTSARQVKTQAGFRNVSVSTGLSVGTINAGGTTDLSIEILNTTDAPKTGLGYSYTLPSGLIVAGAATSTCGGTVAATTGRAAIDLADASVPARDNCTVTVPITSNTPGRYVIEDQAFSVSGALVKAFGLTTLAVTGELTPAPSPASTTPAAAAPSAPPVLVSQVTGPRTTAVRKGQFRTTLRLKYQQTGRYSFFLQNFSGKRIPMLRSSKIGTRVLRRTFSAPVIQGGVQGTDVSINALTSKRPPKASALRVVLRRTDGTLVRQNIPVT
jgi:hypothetical protein